MVYLPADGINPSTNPAQHGRESISQPVDHKSDALTALPSHLCFGVFYCCS